MSKVGASGAALGARQLPAQRHHILASSSSCFDSCSGLAKLPGFGILRRTTAGDQWVFYEAALAQRGADATTERSANVFLSSENILAAMERVANLYVRMGVGV
jgi:hypothetical protein